MDSYYKERCLPGRQILSPTETDFVSHGDKFEFVSQGDKFCPRARPCFQRNCGKGRRSGPLRDVSPAAVLARARSLSGYCGAVKRAFSGDVAHRRVFSLARFVVRSRLDTEKVQALLQEVTELEREVARAYARSRRGKSRTVGDDRHWWFLALAAIAHRGYADARDRLASS